MLFFEGEGGRGGEVKNHSGGLGHALQKSGPLRLQKCVLANYYGTQHSCLENLINSAHQLKKTTKFSFSPPNVLFSQSLSHILSKNARSLSFSKPVYPSVNKFNNGVRFIN